MNLGKYFDYFDIVGRSLSDILSEGLYSIMESSEYRLLQLVLVCTKIVILKLYFLLPFLSFSLSKSSVIYVLAYNPHYKIHDCRQDNEDN